MSTAAQGIKKDIATCKEAADLLRRAEGLMRQVGYSIGIESAVDVIDSCLEDKRRALGELLEKEP